MFLLFKGRIKYYNPNFSYIFGYTNTQQSNTAVATAPCPSTLSSLTTSAILNGKDVSELIPSMKLPLSGITPVWICFIFARLKIESF